MSIESLTYAELGNRLGASPEAARSLARRLMLPRKPGNDGKVRVTVDLSEIQYRPLPARSRSNSCSEVYRLNARVEQLEGELARLEVEKQCAEVRAAGHRADFERERERCDTLVTEALKLGSVAMSAREKAARLDGELSAARPRPRWLRWLGGQTSRSAVRSQARGAVLVGVPVRI
jgi:outer membrane murein-binding lipoprotein Lpp